jgi:hypothetical protein
MSRPNWHTYGPIAVVLEAGNGASTDCLFIEFGYEHYLSKLRHQTREIITALELVLIDS